MRSDSRGSQPGEVVGRILPEIARRTGLGPGTTVVAVGSHDTASAVVGVPATLVGEVGLLAQVGQAGLVELDPDQ